MKRKIVNEAKSEFVTSMSHEIRNPLHAIIQCLQLLSFSKLSNDQLEYVEDAHNGSKLLHSKIRDVLDMSKIATGDMKIMISPSVSILDIVETVADIHSSEANAKNLEIFTFVDPKIPMDVYADETRLEQILSNFLSNSIKFSKSGGHVILSAELISQNEDFVKIKFKCEDVGIGIKEENLKEIFKKYPNVKSTGYRGWELGLSVCKRIVELMNGEIGVTSKYGEGSAFWFQVEFKKCSLDKIQDNLVHGTLNNILIFHENEHFCKILKAYMNHMNIKNSQFVQNEEEMKKLNLLSFDCIIVDKKLLHFVHREKLTPQQRLVVLVQSENEDKGENNEIITTLLKKPIKLNKLMKILSGRKNSLLSSLNWDNKQMSRFMIPPISILVVDDNPINQKVVVKLLKKFGVSDIQVANNGKEAVEQVINRKTSFDLIIMDLMMPVMDGLTATRMIRNLKDEVKSNVCILALTANAWQSSIDDCLACGINDFMEKPISIEKLLFCIKKNLKMK